MKRIKRIKRDAAAPVEAAYIDEVQAAQYLCVARKSLQNWRLKGLGPKFFGFEGSVRYSLSELGSYCASRIAQSTAEADRLDAERKAAKTITDQRGGGHEP
jgi:hypothetical protein